MRSIQCWLSVGAAAALALSARLAIAQPETEPPEGDDTEAQAADEPAELAEPTASPEESPSEAPGATAAPAPPAPAAAPPSDYYTEPPAAGGEPDRAPRASSAPPAVYEPVPPGAGPIYEPPPPPEPNHVAPNNALWLGARGGWWVPFGGAWGSCTHVDAYGYCVEGVSIPMRDFVSSGPMLELDAGVRISRLYNVYFAWERAELGGGNAETLVPMPNADPTQPDELVIVPPSERAETNFYGLGVRFSSDADRVGFLADLLIGFRDMSVEWGANAAGIERLKMGRAPLEFRFGLGADIRLHPLFALSPLVTVGSGRFGNLEWEYSDGTTRDAMGSGDLFAAHGWFTVQLGAHFDFFGQ